MGSSHDDAMPPATGGGRMRITMPRFRRRLRGYDADAVEAWAETVLSQLAAVADEYERLLASQRSTDMQLAESRAEVRFWHDRQSFIEAELERVRSQGAALIEDARGRADEIERAAEQRSLTMIERVCEEANSIMQHARDEAQLLFSRQERDVDAARARVERMTALQQEMSRALRGAMQRFEQGLMEVEHAGPSAQIAPPPRPRAALPVSTHPTAATTPPPAAGAASWSSAGTERPAAPVTPLRLVDVHDGEDTETAGESATGGLSPVEPEPWHDAGSVEATPPTPWRAAAAADEATTSWSGAAAGLQPSHADDLDAAGIDDVDMADAPLSPTLVVLEAYPLHDFPTLSNFERAVGEIDVVSDVYVQSYENGVAELQVTLERPSPLSSLLRRRMPMDLEVDDRRPDRLMVRVRSAQSSAG